MLAEIGDIAAALQARDVLENIIAVVGFAMIFAFEEFELDRATPSTTAIIGKPKPYVYPTALAASTAQGLFQFDGERLALADDFEIAAVAMILPRWSCKVASLSHCTRPPAI